MANILLIDDDQDLVALLGDYLSRDGFVVTPVEDAANAVVEALSGRHAIAVLDVMLPHMSGLDVLRQIRRQSTLPILMLTARGDDADCVAGLELGADDYVAKPCAPRTLAARLRAILRRTAPADRAERSSSSLSCGALQMWPGQRCAEWQGRPLVLTSTEFSLLELLLRQAGRPVSKAALSEHALGRALGKHDRSIDVHVSSLRRKLGALADGRSRVQTVHRIGYQLIKE